MSKMRLTSPKKNEERSFADSPVESPALIETARPFAVARLPQVFFVLPIHHVSNTLLDDSFGFHHVPVYVDAFERFVRSQLLGIAQRLCYHVCGIKAMEFDEKKIWLFVVCFDAFVTLHVSQWRPQRCQQSQRWFCHVPLSLPRTRWEPLVCRSQSCSVHCFFFLL